MEVKRIYEYALQRELEGLRFFTESAQRATHAAVVTVFQRLAQEEQMHVEFIKRILARLDKGEQLSAATVVSELSSGVGWFDRRAETEMIEQTTMESMTPDLPVLRMAYLIEQDLAMFYQQSASRCEGEDRAALELLSRWEQEHERLFKSLHDAAFEAYIQMPWGG